MDRDTYDYLLENRLKMLDPGLHSRFSDTVFAMQNTLFRFQLLFPGFTDHSSLHSMTVIDFCNRLIGPEQIHQLNADAIYVLLMGCYLHDVGMGISRQQYQVFSREIDFGDYFEEHPDAGMERIVRDFHQEFSAAFIRRYSEFLEIPSPEHEYAIIQVCRGHRRTNLLDPSEYPVHFSVKNGNGVYLPYLAALIRLADEIDVLAARNPKMLYDLESCVSDVDVAFFKRHQAVHDMIITDDAFLLKAEHIDQETDIMIEKMVEKMEETLQECRSVVHTASPFRISQSKISWNTVG